jgi:predicted dehydrogenase
MSSPFGLGIVGAGTIAQRVYLPCASQLPGIEVVALFDDREAHGRAVAARHGIAHARSVDELLARQDVDAVVVCTPNATHADLVRAAIEAEHDVLCEKPLATSAAAASRCIDLALSRGRTLLVAHGGRFRRDLALLKSMLEREELGTVREVRLSWLRRHGNPGPETWFTRRRLSGGGALVDLGTHMLDALLWLLPELRSVHPRIQASVSCTHVADELSRARWYGSAAPAPDGEPDVEDAATAVLSYPDGPRVHLDVAWESRRVSSDVTQIDIVGEKGEARLRTLFGFGSGGRRPVCPLTVRLRGRSVTRPEVPGADDALMPYRIQLSRYVDTIRSGAPWAEGARDAVRTCELIEAMYSSAGLASSQAA